MRTFAVVAVALALSGCSPRLPEYQTVEPDGEVIRLPRETVADGDVHFFTYKHQGTNVNFIVRTDGKGRIHTHFDACYSCYRYKRGFVVEGPDLVCIACRYAYRIEDEIWDSIGSCAPITFHCADDGESVVIERSVLENGCRFFS